MKRMVSLVLVSCLAAPAHTLARPVDQTSWSRVQELEPDTAVSVYLMDGSWLDYRVARVDADSITLLDVSRTPLSKNERKTLYRAAAKGASPPPRLGQGALDAESLIRTVPRNQVREIHRVKKGSVLGTIIGAGVGFLVGLAVAVSLALKQCGGSCDDEKVAAILSILGLPTLGGILGYYVGGSSTRLLYRAPGRVARNVP